MHQSIRLTRGLSHSIKKLGQLSVHFGGGQMNPLAVARQDPFEAVVEQPGH